jgi:hypothetical protein
MNVVLCCVVLWRAVVGRAENYFGFFRFAFFAACIFFCWAGEMVRLLACPPLLARCFATVASGMSFLQWGQIMPRTMTEFERASRFIVSGYDMM